MTTITIERKLLEEVVEIFDNSISTRYPHQILSDIRAALEAPATAPDELERKPMHEGEIQAAWLGQDLDESIPYTFVLGIRSAERFNGIKEDKP